METFEYTLISEYFRGMKNEKNDVPLINHIDEGLKILNFISASDIAKRAFCLHPMLQSDEDLVKNLFNNNFRQIDPPVLITTMEYKRVANNYLSNRVIAHLGEIEISPLRDVNQMLIADKVQNYKDFELYYKNNIENSSDLIVYFNNWFKKLGIDYYFLKSKI